MTANDPGLRINDPCFFTPDLHRLLTLPKNWKVVRTAVEWLCVVPNSHRRQSYVEFQYRNDGEKEIDFPYDEFEAFELEYWTVEWVDFVTFGAYNQHVKAIMMLVPTDAFYDYVKSGGKETMSRMSVKNTAIKQKCAAVHDGELYPTDASLVKHQVIRAIGFCVLPELGETVRVLDLCAGPGVYGITAKLMLEKPGWKVELHGIEKNPAFEKPPEFDFWHVGDFRDFEGLDPFHIILTNPPFSLGGEVALYAHRHLKALGAFSMLIGAAFPFSDKGGRGELFTTHEPSQYVYLMSRPGFLFAFGEKAKLKQRYNQSPKATNANEHILVEWDCRPAQPPKRAKWKYYDPENEVHQRLQERGAMVICALTHEAAREISAAKKEKREPVLFNDHFSFLAANRWKWEFFHASFVERNRMRQEIISEESKKALGVSDV